MARYKAYGQTFWDDVAHLESLSLEWWFAERFMTYRVTGAAAAQLRHYQLDPTDVWLETGGLESRFDMKKHVLRVSIPQGDPALHRDLCTLAALGRVE